MKMKMRWLKGDWEFGKYKLQTFHDFQWRDVSTVEENKEPSSIIKDVLIANGRGDEWPGEKVCNNPDWHGHRCDCLEKVKKEKSQKWTCGHVREYFCNGSNPKDEWFCLKQDGNYGYVHGEPKFCPECGAKRPEAPPTKKLADVMKLVRSSSRNGAGKVYWEDQAKATVDYVLEKYEEWRCLPNTEFFNSVGISFDNFLRNEAL